MYRERQDMDKSCKPTHTDTRAKGAWCNHSLQFKMIDIQIHVPPPHIHVFFYYCQTSANTTLSLFYNLDQ